MNNVNLLYTKIKIYLKCIFQEVQINVSRVKREEMQSFPIIFTMLIQNGIMYEYMIEYFHIHLIYYYGVGHAEKKKWPPLELT